MAHRARPNAPQPWRRNCRCPRSPAPGRLLLKGLFEVRDATRPISACEMALIRLAYAAELPPTDKLVKDILDGGGTAPRGPAPTGGAPSGSGARSGSIDRRAAARCRTSHAGRCASRAGSARQSSSWLGRYRLAGGEEWRARVESAHRKRHASGETGSRPSGIPSQPAGAAQPGGRSAAAAARLDRHALDGFDFQRSRASRPWPNRRSTPRPRESKA